MEKTILELSKNEALVFMDFLIRFRDTEELMLHDPAEKQILWDLCAMLEINVPELLDRNYNEHLMKAREIVSLGDEIP